jgi:hypothetical protein
MHVKNRSSGYFNAPKAPSVKDWVIGWTLTEANLAAQRMPDIHSSPARSGMFGTRTPNGRR